MEKRDKDWLEAAARLARRQPKVAGARVCALLVEGGRWLGHGWNQYRTHPLQARFASNPDAIYLHAEIAAIADALRRLKKFHHLGKATLYIARVDSLGDLRIAKPCSGCQQAIVAFEIGRIIWSENAQPNLHLLA